MTRNDDTPSREVLILAMEQAITPADVEAGRTVERLIAAGYLSREITPVIDELERRVLARQPRVGSAFNGAVAAAIVGVVVMMPEAALALDGVPVSHVWGYATVAAMIGGVIGFLACAAFVAGRDADMRAGVCPWDQRLPSGSCMTCGAQRGQPCRGEGA